MAIKAKCDFQITKKCEKELVNYGALLFSPPKSDKNNVKKYHICKECFAAIMEIQKMIITKQF